MILYINDITISFITWLFHPPNSNYHLSIYYALDILCIRPGKVTQGWWFSQQKAGWFSLLWGTETLLSHVFRSLHHITQIIARGDMWRRAGGEQGRHQGIEWLWHVVAITMMVFHKYQSHLVSSCRVRMDAEGCGGERQRDERQRCYESTIGSTGGGAKSFMASLKESRISWSHRENWAEDHGEGLIGKVSKLQHQLQVPPLQVSYAKVRSRILVWGYLSRNGQDQELWTFRFPWISLPSKSHLLFISLVLTHGLFEDFCLLENSLTSCKLSNAVKKMIYAGSTCFVVEGTFRTSAP